MHVTNPERLQDIEREIPLCQLFQVAKEIPILRREWHVPKSHPDAAEERVRSESFQVGGKGGSSRF